MSSSSSPTTLTCTGGPFAGSDIGDGISVAGAGPSGGALNTYISGYTSTNVVTLSIGASTTVSGASAYWTPYLYSTTYTSGSPGIVAIGRYGSIKSFAAGTVGPSGSTQTITAWDSQAYVTANDPANTSGWTPAWPWSYTEVQGGTYTSGGCEGPYPSLCNVWFSATSQDIWEGVFTASLISGSTYGVCAFGPSAQMEYRIPAGSDQYVQAENVGTITDGDLYNYFLLTHHQSLEQNGVPGLWPTLTASCLASGSAGGPTYSTCYDFNSDYVGVEPEAGSCTGKPELCTDYYHYTTVDPLNSAAANNVISVRTSTYIPSAGDNIRVERHGKYVFGLYQAGGSGAWATAFIGYRPNLQNNVGYPGVFCAQQNGGSAKPYLNNFYMGTLSDYGQLPVTCSATGTCGYGTVGMVY